MANEIQPAAEFSPLPLEMIIATPLLSVVKAQRLAAEATLEYIQALATDGNGAARTIDINYQKVLPAAAGAPPQVQQASVKAPLLSIVPVPHLRIDSLSVNFKYEVTQTVVDKSATEFGVQFGAQTGAGISAFVNASLKGSVSHSSSSENTVHRGGTLDITVRASEAPMPAGLESLLRLLANGIQAT